MDTQTTWPRIQHLSCACVVEEYARFDTRHPFYRFSVILLPKKFLPTTYLLNLWFCNKEGCLGTLEHIETVCRSIWVRNLCEIAFATWTVGLGCLLSVSVFLIRDWHRVLVFCIDWIWNMSNGSVIGVVVGLDQSRQDFHIPSTVGVGEITLESFLQRAYERFCYGRFRIEILCMKMIDAMLL